jgi:hypothetical protein
MNGNRIAQEIYEAFAVVWGGILGGYWLSYIFGSHRGIFMVTPETVWVGCCAATAAIIARVAYRMYTFPDR